MTPENYDSTWYRYAHEAEEITDYGGFRLRFPVVKEQPRPLDDYLREQMTKIKIEPSPTWTPERLAAVFGPQKNPMRTTPSDKEKQNMNRDDTYFIDQTVREAIEKPRRAAEVAVRVAAVNAIQAVIDASETGAVLRFGRKYSGKDYTFAVIKTDNDLWYVTGSQASGRDAYTAENLLVWMTTGDTIVFDVQVASEFTPVTWTPEPVDMTVTVPSES